MDASFDPSDGRASLGNPGHAPIEGDDLFAAVFARAYRYWRRWDEGLWRYLELSAVARLLRERPMLVDGPILDIGCGNGEVFEWMFGRRDDAYGVDNAATHKDDVTLARLSARYAEVREEDASAMSFGGDTFQLVFSNSVLEHIDPVDPVLREAHRVLQPGGWFVFTTPDPRLYAPEGYFWQAGALPGLERIGRAMAGRECHLYQHVSVLDPEDWVSRLHAAGFGNVERRTYVSPRVARVITRYSALTRTPVLSRVAWLASREARSLSRPSETSLDRWTRRSRAVLRSHLDDIPANDEGCGQLVIARKPEHASARPHVR